MRQIYEWQLSLPVSHAMILRIWKVADWGWRWWRFGTAIITEGLRRRSALSLDILFSDLNCRLYLLLYDPFDEIRFADGVLTAFRSCGFGFWFLYGLLGEWLLDGFLYRLWLGVGFRFLRCLCVRYLFGSLTILACIEHRLLWLVCSDGRVELWLHRFNRLGHDGHVTDSVHRKRQSVDLLMLDRLRLMVYELRRLEGLWLDILQAHRSGCLDGCRFWCGNWCRYWCGNWNLRGLLGLCIDGLIAIVSECWVLRILGGGQSCQSKKGYKLDTFEMS